jgi:methionyl-tRNA formyltransferase
MILSKETTIGTNESAGELHDRLMQLGSEAVIETLHLIEEGKATTTVQTENHNVKTAYKLNKDNCKIDWTQSGKTIFNLIRGLSPYPAAWTYIKDGENEWNVKIYAASFEEKEHTDAIGKISTTKKEIFITTKDGVLKIISLQFPAKKRMQAHELLNGISFSENAMAL